MKYADLSRFKALDNGRSLTVRNVMLLCTDVVETPVYFLNMFSPLQWTLILLWTPLLLYMVFWTIINTVDDLLSESE